MPEIHIRIGYVTECDRIQLTLATAASSIDDQQRRPRKESTDKRNQRHHFEVADEQIIIQRLVVEDEFIWQFTKGGDPVEHAKRRLGCFLPVSPSAKSALHLTVRMYLLIFECIKKRTRGIHSMLLVAEIKEGKDDRKRNDEQRDNSCNQLVGRRRATLIFAFLRNVLI